MNTVGMNWQNKFYFSISFSFPREGEPVDPIPSETAVSVSFNCTKLPVGTWRRTKRQNCIAKTKQSQFIFHFTGIQCSCSIPKKWPIGARDHFHPLPSPSPSLDYRPKILIVPQRSEGVSSTHSQSRIDDVGEKRLLIEMVRRSVTFGYSMLRVIHLTFSIWICN